MTITNSIEKMAKQRLISNSFARYEPRHLVVLVCPVVVVW